MVYDAENRMTSYTKAGVTTNYVYDGDGRRVSKSDSSATLLFVYNASGQLIAEYSSSQPTGTPTTSYLTTDMLGSTRVVTDQNQAVKARHDYLPFGEEIGSDKGGRSGVTGYTAADSIRQRFTSKERDIESGMDYFLARYYSASQGRFTSPDEFTGGPDELFDFADDASDNPTFYADIFEPQSLNKYQYCYNNPFRYVDPDGHDGGATVAAEVLRAGAGAAARRATYAIPGFGQVLLATEIVLGVFKALDDGKPTGDGSCPSCEGSMRAVQRRLEQQEAQNNAQAEQNATVHQKNGEGEKVLDPVSGKEVTPSKAKNLADADAKGVPRGQLGPSGKPKVKTVKHPTEKRAKDAAQARSRGSVPKDLRPSKGGPHYHETKQNGDRKKGTQNIHHEFPRRRGRLS
jgi:RHS repeat-associated protein